MGGAGLRKPKGAQGGSVPEQELCPSEVLSLVPSSVQSLARKSSGQGDGVEDEGEQP